MLYEKISADHKPEDVELERLPNGTAWLRLHKNAAAVKIPKDAPEGEPTVGGFTVDEAVCLLPESRAEEETVETITASFADWYAFASEWDPEDNTPPSLEQQVADLSELCMSLIG